MTDRRAHRGPHPEDAELFAPAALPRLREAAGDFAWLLDRGYASPSALKLVGDRHGLLARQRLAVARATCSRDEAARRQAHQVAPSALAGQPLEIDGYNALTTIEAALAGGVIFRCRDGSCRDMASMHGSYRRVEETVPALALLGSVLADLGTAPARWYLDAPVSNSGRLKTLIGDLARQSGWDWTIQLVPDPDPLLAASAGVIASADSAILNLAAAWFNLARHTVETHIPRAWIVDLS